MKKIILLSYLIISQLFGQTLSSYQSPARPFDLDIVNPVMLAGSDEKSEYFQKNVLPSLLGISNQNLSRRTSFNNWKAIEINSTLLTLPENSYVRTYFLGANASFRNSLGFTLNGDTPFDKSAQLIFPDASGRANGGGSNNLRRDRSNPLIAGDFVDLGYFPINTKLDFFLIADGANKGRRYFSTDVSQNGDGLYHAVSFMSDASTYLMIGFEDIWGGGDRDYNDSLFVVEYTPKYESGIAAPEPSLALGFMFGSFFLLSLRRR